MLARFFNSLVVGLSLAFFSLFSSAATVSYTPTLASGWNLVGNSTSAAVDVKTLLGTQAGSVTSVWKWNAANSKWAFYSPALDTANTLASYAAAKGYDVLSSIDPGDGFWINVNATSGLVLGAQSGTGFAVTASTLKPSWNLVATGDDSSPAVFSTTVSNVTTLWAWNSANSGWYFYAPSMTSSALAGYISSKKYQDFGNTTLGNGRGFWVNYAGTGTGGTGGTTPVVGLMGGNILGKALVLNPANVTTFAGTGTMGAADGSGIAASFNEFRDFTTDGTHLYMADAANNKIRKIELATGLVTSLAGSGVVGAADGMGAAATFSYPTGITTDGVNLYVADTNNRLIRKIVIATGSVSTLAGSGTLNGVIDGTGSAASFVSINCITTDGTNLYIVDGGSQAIRKIVIATGVVTTLTTPRSFSFPFGMTTDGTYLYMADTGNHLVHKITIATGAVTTLAGSGTAGAADGTGSAASFNSPGGIATDGVNLYVSDSVNQKIRQIDVATGAVTTLAGSGYKGATAGVGTGASFYYPYGLSTDGKDLYVADMSNYKIRKISGGGGSASSVTPVAPEGVTATPASTTQVNLSWNAVTGAIGYYVYLGNVPNMASSGMTNVTAKTASNIAPTTATSLAVRRLPTGISYYRVTAIFPNGESAGSTEVSVVSNPIPPYIGASIMNLPDTAGNQLYFAQVNVGTDVTSILSTSTITNASISVNAVNVPYSSVGGSYMAVVAPDTAGKFTVTITLDGHTYSITAPAITSFPTVTMPSPFAADVANTISWTAPPGAVGSLAYGFEISSSVPGSVTIPVAGSVSPGMSLTSFEDVTTRQILFSQTTAATSVTVPANTLKAGTSYEPHLIVAWPSLIYPIADANTGSKLGMGTMYLMPQLTVAAAAPVLPATPATVATQLTTDNKTSITWSAVSGAIAYNIYRSTSPNVAISAANKVGSAADVSTAFSDTGLAAATTYYYKVTAITADAESLASSEVTTTTLAAAPVNAGPVGTQMGGARQGTVLSTPSLVSTLAGSTSGQLSGYVDDTGTAAKFQFPMDITTDGTYLFVTDSSNHVIRKIEITTGVTSTLAGSGVAGSADGTGVDASFNQPEGLTTDGSSVYVADVQNHKIRKIEIATGVVTTVAGTGTSGFVDGAGSIATFSRPARITTDGTNLYVTDTGNYKIRQIVIATDVVSTLAGSTRGYVNGIGTATKFSETSGITTDGVNLYVVDNASLAIRKIVIASQEVTTLIGPSAPWFANPRGITTDGTNLYVANSQTSLILKVEIATGTVTKLAGAGISGFADGASLTAAKFNMPWGVTTDGLNLYVADTYSHKIRKIGTTEALPASLAVLATPTGVTASNHYGNNIFLSWPTVPGAQGYYVYRATAPNLPLASMTNITTGSALVGPSLHATSLFDAFGLAAGTSYYYRVVALDATGASEPSFEISATAKSTTTNSNTPAPAVTGLMGGAVLGTPLSASGVVSAFAGSGVVGTGDGSATTATFNKAGAITTDGTSLYVAEYLTHLIRKIDIATGAVSTIAGSGTRGATDGPGTAASFNNPHGISTDGSSLYVADTGNKTIRKIVLATGVVTTLAGSGRTGGADGVGKAASFQTPVGLTTDGSNLYIVDSGNQNIRQLALATGTVTTVAGIRGFPGLSDGIGASAGFYGPNAITTDG
ncbi:MAG: hypothetical protein PHH58_14340, partial [Rhodoferax sp.]|nr:hypothetical protein [Rhodoferax sp.]